jgi:hypothetical protein
MRPAQITIARQAFSAPMPYWLSIGRPWPQHIVRADNNAGTAPSGRPAAR